MPDDDNVVEGSQVTPTEKYVPLTKYIGVKEMLKKREETLTEAETKVTTLQGEVTTYQTKVTELETEVKNLGEQVTQAKQSAVDPGRIKTLESERDASKTELAQMKQTILFEKHRIKPEEVEGMNEEQIQAYIKGKGQAGKPGADLGGGAGATPQTSARGQIRSGFDALHPSDK